MVSLDLAIHGLLTGDGNLVPESVAAGPDLAIVVLIPVIERESRAGVVH